MMPDVPLTPPLAPARSETHETLAAVRAIRRIAQALAVNQPVCAEDVDTAGRVLEPQVSWEGLMRAPRDAPEGARDDAG